MMISSFSHSNKGRKTNDKDNKDNKEHNIPNTSSSSSSSSSTNIDTATTIPCNNDNETGTHFFNETERCVIISGGSSVRTQRAHYNGRSNCSSGTSSSSTSCSTSTSTSKSSINTTRREKVLHVGNDNNDTKKENEKELEKQRQIEIVHSLIEAERLNNEKSSVIFPVKLHALLEDAETLNFKDIISWQGEGYSFKIYDTERFANEIMQTYFDQCTKFKSFHRQLNIYGFKRIPLGPYKGGYAHSQFCRPDPKRCESMQRQASRKGGTGTGGGGKKGTKKNKTKGGGGGRKEVIVNSSKKVLGETRNKYGKTTSTMKSISSPTCASSSSTTDTTATDSFVNKTCDVIDDDINKNIFDVDWAVVGGGSNTNSLHVLKESPTSSSSSSMSSSRVSDTPLVTTSPSAEEKNSKTKRTTTKQANNFAQTKNKRTFEMMHVRHVSEYEDFTTQQSYYSPATVFHSVTPPVSSSPSLTTESCETKAQAIPFRRPNAAASPALPLLLPKPSSSPTKKQCLPSVESSLLSLYPQQEVQQQQEQEHQDKAADGFPRLDEAEIAFLDDVMSNPDNTFTSKSTSGSTYRSDTNMNMNTNGDNKIKTERDGNTSVTSDVIVCGDSNNIVNNNESYNINNNRNDTEKPESVGDSFPTVASSFSPPSSLSHEVVNNNTSRGIVGTTSFVDPRINSEQDFVVVPNSTADARNKETTRVSEASQSFLDPVLGSGGSVDGFMADCLQTLLDDIDDDVENDGLTTTEIETETFQSIPSTSPKQEEHITVVSNVPKENNNNNNNNNDYHQKCDGEGVKNVENPSSSSFFTNLFYHNANVNVSTNANMNLNASQKLEQEMFEESSPLLLSEEAAEEEESIKKWRGNWNPETRTKPQSKPKRKLTERHENHFQNTFMSSSPITNKKEKKKNENFLSSFCGGGAISSPPRQQWGLPPPPPVATVVLQREKFAAYYNVKKNDAQTKHNDTSSFNKSSNRNNDSMKSSKHLQEINWHNGSCISNKNRLSIMNHYPDIGHQHYDQQQQQQQQKQRKLQREEENYWWAQPYQLPQERIQPQPVAQHGGQVPITHRHNDVTFPHYQEQESQLVGCYNHQEIPNCSIPPHMEPTINSDNGKQHKQNDSSSNQQEHQSHLVLGSSVENQEDQERMLDETSFPFRLHTLLMDAERGGLGENAKHIKEFSSFASSFEHVVSWVDNGTAFQVHNRKAFVKYIMPNYFDQTKFESFRRQLNMYGFQRVSKGERRGVVSHPCFLKADRSLCRFMTRNVPSSN